MPALTHGRVKNGFNGGIRYKKNSISHLSKRLATDNNTKEGKMLSKSIVGGVGSKTVSNRAAIQRRTGNANNSDKCCVSEPQKTVPRVGQESAVRRRV